MKYYFETDIDCPKCLEDSLLWILGFTKQWEALFLGSDDWYILLMESESTQEVLKVAMQENCGTYIEFLREEVLSDDDYCTLSTKSKAYDGTFSL